MGLLELPFFKYLGSCTRRFSILARHISNRRGSILNSQTQRSVWVEQAKHSLYLEGLLTSAEYNEDAERYVSGAISADQLVEKTRARFILS